MNCNILNLAWRNIYIRWAYSLWIISMVIFGNSMQSDLSSTKSSSQENEFKTRPIQILDALKQKRFKKYNLAICAIIKNEAKYLKEWIEFHRLVGVEHFYLYSNETSDLLRSTLKPYFRKGLVTFIHWIDFSEQIEDETEHWALSTQLPAYENAIKFRALKTTKWLALLNTDEYLVPVCSYKITELLQQYDSYPAIALETDVFDGSQSNLSPSTHMLIESKDLIKPPPQSLYKSFTKLILKPELCAGFAWPPYQIQFQDNQQPISLNRSDMRINCYANRDKPFLDPLKHKLYIHSRFMPRSTLSELLDQGYAIEDEEQAIARYLPELRIQCIGNTP